MAFTEQDTIAYRLVIFFLTLTFTIVGAVNISNYNAILNDTNDDNIGLGRGTVMWFKALNVIMIIICILLFLYNLWRIVFVKSVKITIPSAFFKEAGFVKPIEPKTETPVNINDVKAIAQEPVVKVASKSEENLVSTIQPMTKEPPFKWETGDETEKELKDWFIQQVRYSAYMKKISDDELDVKINSFINYCYINRKNVEDCILYATQQIRELEDE